MNRYKVVLFKSRNKDNKEVTGFKERCMVFLWNKDKLPFNRFDDFVKRGLPGEKCRLYISVNDRDGDRTRRALLINLINNPECDLSKMESLTASIAAKPENRAESKWLFDVDTTDKEQQKSFLEDLVGTFREKISSNELPTDMYFNMVNTPNGIGVIVPHGFDTRELLNKWGDIVTLKRDAMLFVTIKENELDEE